MSSYWHCISEELFLFDDHDMHLNDGSCLMLRSLCSLNFLSGSSISGNKSHMFPWLGLSAVLVSQEKKDCNMFLLLEFSHRFFCLLQSCWDISTLAGLANSSDALV